MRLDRESLTQITDVACGTGGFTYILGRRIGTGSLDIPKLGKGI